MPVDIPGATELRVGVYDRNMLSKDAFIGETVIDLEDRWFSQEWRDLGMDDCLMRQRGPLKPLEARSLFAPTNATPRGQLQMWVDIVPKAEAARYAPVALAPASTVTGELRICCYRAEDVKDPDNDTMDLYCRFRLEGRKARTTEKHYRCSNGKPCWNYRVKVRCSASGRRPAASGHPPRPPPPTHNTHAPPFPSSSLARPPVTSFLCAARSPALRRPPPSTHTHPPTRLHSSTSRCPSSRARWRGCTCSSGTRTCSATRAWRRHR